MQDRPEFMQQGAHLRTRAKIHTTWTPPDCLMSVNTLVRRSQFGDNHSHVAARTRDSAIDWALAGPAPAAVSRQAPLARRTRAARTPVGPAYPLLRI